VARDLTSRALVVAHLEFLRPLRDVVRMQVPPRQDSSRILELMRLGRTTTA
jgi:hypothetical protein